MTSSGHGSHERLDSYTKDKEEKQKKIIINITKFLL